MIYRPLIFFLIEFTLSLLVLKKGKFLPKRIAPFLLLLSFYQLGEAIILLTSYDKFGASFAYAFATILPAAGIWIIEGVVDRNLGSKILFPYYFVMGAVFFIYPGVIKVVGEQFCFLKVLGNPENNSQFLELWKIAYPAGLTYGIILILIFLFKVKNHQLKKDLMIILIAYFLFFPTSILLLYLFGVEGGYTSSVTCAMAFLSGLLASWYSLRGRTKSH